MTRDPRPDARSGWISSSGRIDGTAFIARLLVAAAFAVAIAGFATPSTAQPLPGLGPPSAEAPAAAPGSVPAEASAEQDRAIARRLREIYAAVEGLEGVGIEVRAGVVQLSGEVLSNEAAERAARIARTLQGVVEVQSQIAVVHDVDRRLAPMLEAFRTRAAALLGVLPLLGVALVVVALFYGLARLATAWERPYRRLARNGFARDLLRQAMRVAILGCGVVIALEILDATAIVAAAAAFAGLAGLAISFAFRDIAENYIASVLLSVRQPFLPHDHVVIEGHEGRIARLTSRATLLIDFAGNHVRIPNSIVFKSVIRNYTRNPVRRFDFTVRVPAATTNLADAVALGTRALARTRGTLDEPPAQGWIAELGDPHVILHFFAWIDQRSADWFRTRSEGIRAVKEAFDWAGITQGQPARQRAQPRPAEVGSAAPRAAEPKLDVSPDPHLDREVELDRAAAAERADGAADMLDPAAPRE